MVGRQARLRVRRTCGGGDGLCVRLLRLDIPSSAAKPRHPRRGHRAGRHHVPLALDLTAFGPPSRCSRGPRRRGSHGPRRCRRCNFPRRRSGRSAAAGDLGTEPRQVKGASWRLSGVGQLKVNRRKACVVIEARCLLVVRYCSLRHARLLPLQFGALPVDMPAPQDGAKEDEETAAQREHHKPFCSHVIACCAERL